MPDSASRSWCLFSAGGDSWQSELTMHTLSHSNVWAYLTQGLNLLGNLCGLAAIIKEVAVALSQASQSSLPLVSHL